MYPSEDEFAISWYFQCFRLLLSKGAIRFATKCEPRAVVRVRVRRNVIRIRVNETAIRIRVVTRTTNDTAPGTRHLLFCY